MKKLIRLLFFCSLLISTTGSVTSCSKKTGCKIQDNAGVKTNKKGQLPMGKGKSSLFPKTMKKNKKKKRNK